MVDFNLVKHNDKESIVVIIDGTPETVASTHSNYGEIKALLIEGDQDEDFIKSLIEAKRNIPNQLRRLSERITLRNGELFFDGEAINTNLSRHILRLAEEGSDRLVSFVRFMEHLATNPSQLSRIHLFTWLNSRDFTLTEDGLIVGYKSVRLDPEDGVLKSINSGTNKVLVNDEVHTGRVPNPIGAVVEMARAQVNADRDQGCHTGLHVGTFDYADTFGGSDKVILEVHVNPRDVVAVPSESEYRKMRVCRYKVIGEIEQKYTAAVLWPADDAEVEENEELTWEEEACDECGDTDCDGLCYDDPEEEYDY